jgi:uncharacterized protein
MRCQSAVDLPFGSRCRCLTHRAVAALELRQGRVAAPGPTFWRLAAVLAALSAGEVAVGIGLPLVALGVDLVLLFGLIFLSGFGSEGERGLALALSLAPLIRVTSLTLPPNLPPLAWYMVASLCLLAACGIVARLLGYSLADLGCQAGDALDQLAIASLGLPVAVVAFLIDTKPSWLPMSSVAAMLVSSAVLAGVGVVEEIVFRGLLQRAAFSLLRGRGLVYVSALFMVLHTGVGGGITALLMFGVGLLFAELAQASGSLLGVAAAHASANVLLYVVLPALAYRAG